MNMHIKYQNQEKREVRAEAFMRQVAKDYNSGKTAQQIADFYMNPKTGKNYTRSHIYWILNKAKDLNL
jgi:hypothetical protein